jgi:WhiB family redox-sensing transcriptional regulator
VTGESKRWWHRAPTPDLPRAACAGQDTARWFPRPSVNVSPATLRICAGCPERAPCLEYALAVGPMLRGVWGGMTERERARRLAGHRVA